MKLILTRHGETVENAAGIIQGHLQGKLSELGKAQAKRLAQRLKNEKIDIIYSSDLTRAADTAKEIATYHPEIPLLLVKEIRERKHGDFDGRKRSEIDASAEEASLFTSITTAPKNGESWLQVYERARMFLGKLNQKHKKQTVLLVSHGGFIRAMICAIKSQPPEEIFNVAKIGNTSISIFEIRTDNYKIQQYNCAKHLD